MPQSADPRRPSDSQRPRAVGLVDDEVVCAWASWDTLELRSETGEVRLVASPRPEHSFRIHDVRFVAGRYVVCGIGTGIMSHGLWSLDLHEETWAPPLLERWSDVGVLAGCHDTPSVLFADGADVVRWDLARNAEAGRLPGPDAYAGAFAPGGILTALAGPRGLVLFDENGEERVHTEWVGAEPTAMAFVGQHAVLTAAFEGEIRLHDLASLTPRAATRLDAREIDHLAVSPDGRRVACSGGGVTHLLDTATLEPLCAPREATAAAFTEDGCVVFGSRGARWIE
ncbi:MAG: WD40 repeat domain-containing protein [Sandaracinaceae bacterium]